MKISRLMNLTAVICLGLLPALALSVYAENTDSEKRVNVKVLTSEEGTTSVSEEVLEVDGTVNIEDVLRQLGIVDELGELADDEVVEIIIRRKKDEKVVRGMEIEVDPFVPGIQTERRPGAFLGVHITDVPFTSFENPTEQSGAYITSIIPNTGAEASELQAGDIIVRVDDVAIANYGELMRVIRSHKPGDKVQLVYLRNGVENSIEATLGERPAHSDVIRQFDVSPERMERFQERMERYRERMEEHRERLLEQAEELAVRPFLGVRLDLGRENAAALPGLKVLSIIEGSTAEEMALQAGDIITAVDGKAITGFNDLRAALDATEIGNEVRVDYIRGDSKAHATAAIKSRAGITTLDQARLERLQENIPQWGGDWNNLPRMQDFNWQEEGKVLREVKITLALDNLSEEEARNLSRRTGEDIRADSDLFMESLEVYPNPNNGAFNLSFELPEDGAAEVKIYDMAGNEVHSESLTGFSGRYSRMIDISGNARGAYFLQITQNGKSFTQKIITE